MLRKLLLTLGVTCALSPILSDRPHAAVADIVLTANHVVDMHGHWSRAVDSSSAGGVMLTSTDTGWSNTVGPAIAPSHYVDFTFAPQPNTPYRVWLRMRAKGSSKYNDSVFVQFSNARDASNRAMYRVGTTEGLLVNRQRCSSCGLNAWGWYDGSYWLQATSTLLFADGSQTLRVQTREDGVEIDQIVLSPTTFFSKAPGVTDYDTTIVASGLASTSTPYFGAPIDVVTAIAADAFDEGGAAVAYHDTTIGSTSVGSRTTNVDLMPLSGGGYAVTAIEAGEWLNYTIQVDYADQYMLEIDVASNGGGGVFHIDVNGNKATGMLTIPNTGNVATFATLTQPMNLAAGTHTLRVVFDTKATASAFAAIRLSRPRSSSSGTSVTLPGVVSAAEFDNGGQGLSWLDSTPGNAGGQLRNSDVDIYGSATNGYYVADTAAGEWLEYAVKVAQPGSYIVRFEVGSTVDGGQVWAQVGSGASSHTGAIAVPNTGRLTSWTMVAAPVQLEAGEQFMRVGVAAGGIALRNVHVDPAPTFTTFKVPAGGNLQAAINAAEPGDVILLEAGATYVGNFKLPAKDGEEYITIRSSAPDATLPAEGVRLTPAYAARLPKLRSPNNQPSLATEPYAHHYRIQFIEFLANVNGYGHIIALGDATSAQNSLAVVPHHLIIDRVYVHGDVVAGQKRGIALNSAHTTIANSYISEIKAVGQDSQAIGGWNGPGPYLIANNYLEAAGENIMFGGSDPAIVNLVPSDIVITGNHLFKPLSWRGTSWSVKNLFELKSGQRILIDGNLMENNWLNAQNGYAVLMKSVNQDGNAPWSVVQDITFTNNIVRHVASAINVLGRDWRYPAVVANNIVIRNNLFEDVSGAKYGGSGRVLQISGTIGVKIEHNTVIADGSTPVAPDGAANERFVFNDNVLHHNLYGIKGTGTAIGNGTIAHYFPYAEVTGSLFIGGKASLYPVGNFFAASVDAVGFVDYAGGDYRLAESSIYRGAATDGTDPGVDYSQLTRAYAAKQQ